MTQPKVGKNKWNQEISDALEAYRLAHRYMGHLLRNSESGPEARGLIYAQIAHALADISAALVELQRIGNGDREDEQRQPAIVCLCGSTRFSEAFREANFRETLAGRVVLTIGCDTRTDGDLFGQLPEAEMDRIKASLDELHLRKIDLADEVLILNVGGYIGRSTRRELEYALKQGKRVRYLEDTAPNGKQ